MSEWNNVAQFISGEGFWYSDPLREIKGLSEEQLFWVPGPHALCILWHAGHIAHRERMHVAWLIQRQQGELVPEKYEVFGPDWCSVEDMRRSIGPVEGVFEWVKEIKAKTHEFIASLSDDDFRKPVLENGSELTVAHWLFITAAHAALHIGRIQLLRALIEGKHERAC